MNGDLRTLRDLQVRMASVWPHGSLEKLFYKLFLDGTCKEAKRFRRILGRTQEKIPKVIILAIMLFQQLSRRSAWPHPRTTLYTSPQRGVKRKTSFFVSKRNVDLFWSSPNRGQSRDQPV
mmetsp:Transcript_18420/g.37715  ORF Transcript_18420/g.37715 Transcript_18420/m.37715 type:complete len:120 (-) Transcript_18420:1402-1761(-)